MEKFVITVDSACDCALSELRKNNVEVIFFKYSDGTKMYTDTMDETGYRKFYQDMKDGKVFKTSQINPQEYYEFFEQFIKQGKKVLHVSLASGLSNTFNNIFVAKAQLEENYPGCVLHPIDSKLASLGLTQLVDQAIICRDKGMDIEETYTYVSGLVKHINTYYTTDDLKYFGRGGRLSKIEAFVGNVLHINPILDCLPDGQLRVIAKVRGIKKATKLFYDKIDETLEHPEDQTLYICHADAEERALRIRDTLMSKYKFKDVKVYFMGPIIGSHAGPGLLAAFYFGKPRIKPEGFDEQNKKEYEKDD